MNLNKINILCATIIVTCLSACSAWDDYEHPETKTPESWNTNLNGDNSWPDVEWWKRFNSPQLTELMETAQKENYDLKSAAARVHEADAQVRISGAALLPSVDASANAERSHQPTGTRLSNVSSSVGGRSYANNSFNATANASYELDFWGKNWSAERSAEALAEGSRYDKQVVFLTTTSSVANTYFNILATQNRLAVAEANLHIAQKLLDSIKRRQKEGVAAALDVAQQESVVDSQLAVIPPLQLQLTQNLDALAILVGKLPEDLKLTDEKLSAVSVPEVESGLPSGLLERRPDVQEAEAQLIAANADIINARAQFFPDISLTAEGGYASSKLSQLLKPESSLFTLGGSLLQPIFEGGLLSGQLKFSKARYDELLQDYQKSAISAYSDVEDALAAVEQSTKSEAANAATAQAALKAFDLSDQQYKSGVVDITTVMITQRTLFSAEDSLLQARQSRLQSVVTLYQALGGGWKVPEKGKYLDRPSS